MLREFGHPVVTCCDMLGVVGSNLKMIKFFMQHLWMLHDVVVVWPCNSVARSPGRFSTRNMSQHAATRWPNACNMLRPPILRSVAFKCSDRLAGASKCWTNKCWDVLRWDVAIVWPGLSGVTPYTEVYRGYVSQSSWLVICSDQNKATAMTTVKLKLPLGSVQLCSH